MRPYQQAILPRYRPPIAPLTENTRTDVEYGCGSPDLPSNGLKGSTSGGLGFRRPLVVD